MGNTGNPTTRLVLNYLRNHAGQMFHYADIASDLNIEPNRVNAALTRAVSHHPQYGVVREGSGQYVFYKSRETPPEPEHTGPMIFEEVGTTRAGVIIVRDEKGALYSLGDVL